MTNMTVSTQRQLDLEKESVELGVSRYRKERLAWQLEDASATPEADTKPGTILIKQYLFPLSDAIQAWKDDITLGKARRQALLIKVLSQLDSDTIAFITLRGIINAMTTETTLQDAAKYIVNPLLDEINHNRLKTDAPGYAFVLQDTLKKSTSDRHRKGVLKNAMGKAGVTTMAVDLSERQRITSLLIELAIVATNLCKLVTTSRGKRDTIVILRPTDEVAQWLLSTHSRCELMSPIHLPMLCPPLDWTSPDDGGYLSGRKRLSFVKAFNQNYMEDLKSWDMPQVYEAVNNIQSTGWKINAKVYEVMKTVWDEGRTLGGLPSRDGLPFPAKPMDMESNEEARTNWKREAAKVHEANNKLVTKRISTSQKLWMAEKFIDEPVIYYPHVLDWRGRVYPAAGIGAVNPQGDDTGKSLLMFAEGKRLGEAGAYWLACHIAGLFGVDKVPFDERVTWTEEHSTELCMSAEEPLLFQMWAGADDPYLALAAIFEWNEFQQHGVDYLSHLPIPMDGSNNGAQHLSAMGRDSRATVNLVPSERPQDIYMDVAKVVTSIVAEKAREEDIQAVIWDGKISRSIAKRPVMTLCYGATVRGMALQIEDEVRKAATAGEPIIASDDIRASCNWLASIMYPAIGQVTVSAVEIMDWLKDTAKVTASNELPVRWVTPAGFPVLQHYRKLNTKVIDAVIAGARVQVTLGEETNELNRRRQSAGISPNFVHSLDASHLMVSVNAMKAAGITSFAMIHDSYGCHAADVDTMNRVIRKEFVKMYSEHVLEDFRNQIIKQLPESLAECIKEIPPRGDLELDGIEDSLYFFA